MTCLLGFGVGDGVGEGVGFGVGLGLFVREIRVKNICFLMILTDFKCFYVGLL